MKKIIKILFIIIMTVPLIVRASLNYDDAVNYANNYIQGFDQYLDYIYLKENLPLYFQGNKATINSIFKNGGFISADEYNISNSRGNTFLSNGLQYWTSTGVGANQHYMIDYKLTKQTNTEGSGVRVTEYVNPNVIVTGKGSYYEPWVFNKALSIDITSENANMGKVSTVPCSNTSSKKEEIHLTTATEFYTCPEEGYKYIDNTCSKYIGNYVNSDRHTISSLERDSISCKVIFSYKTKSITLAKCSDCTTANEDRRIYVSTKFRRIFSDSNGVNKLEKIDLLPKRTGYTFKGYYTSINYLSSEKIIDENGKITYNDKLNTESTLYPYVEANKYTIEFDSNGGDSLSKKTLIVTYDQKYSSLAETSKAGYEFLGWYTSASGGTKITNNDIVKILSDKSLYAHWKACPEGTYSENGKKCVDAPEGYTCDRLSTSIESCYRRLYRARTCTSFYRCEAAGCETYNSCKSKLHCGDTTTTKYVSKGGISCSTNNGTVRDGYTLSNCTPAGGTDEPYDALTDCKCTAYKVKSCENVTCTCKEYNSSYEKCGCEKWSEWGNYVPVYCPTSEFCDSKIFYYPN